MRALSSAQQPIVDETSTTWSENDEALSVGGDRYQIVSSCLPVNGDYQIEKRMYRLRAASSARTRPGTRSVLSSPSHGRRRW